MLETIVILASTIILGLSPFVVEWRQKQLLEGSWRHEKREVVAKVRVARAEAVQSAWQAKHVLSERTFLLSGVVGLVPGVAAAVWWGWRVPLKFAALMGACLAIGLVYGMDWFLVRLRRQSEKLREDDGFGNWP